MDLRFDLVPLTGVVVTLKNGRSAFGLSLDFAVLTGSLVVLIAIAARLYPPRRPLNGRGVPW